MLLTHAVTLAEARSHVAALADQARNAQVSSAFEHVLLELDRIHGDNVPGLGRVALVDHRTVPLLVAAKAGIEALTAYGVGTLQIELVLAMLDDAQTLDES